MEKEYIPSKPSPIPGTQNSDTRKYTPSKPIPIPGAQSPDSRNTTSQEGAMTVGSIQNSWNAMSTLDEIFGDRAQLQRPQAQPLQEKSATTTKPSGR